MDTHVWDGAQPEPGGELPEPVIGVAIVDDHQLMAEALALVVKREPGLRWLGQAGTCAAAVALAGAACPDVLLLDVSLPDGDGLALVPALRTACPQVRILVLTSLADQATLQRALGAGVAGFIGKQQPVSDVLAAIRQAGKGETVLPAPLFKEMLNRRGQPSRGDRPQADGDRPVLTARELEVLARAAEGYSSEQIAQQLTLSILTVRTHLRNITRKLDAHSRLEAVAIALRQGILAPQRANRAR